MVDTAALLAAYDTQMRMAPGTTAGPGVINEYDGPLLRIVGPHMGRIRAPRDLGVTGPALDRLIARQRDYFKARNQAVEWKLRSHDLPADLPDRLTAAGFTRGDPAAVLIAEAEAVAADPILPTGVTLRQTTDEDDLHRIADQQTEVWGFDCSWVGPDLAARVATGQVTVLVAESGGRIVCSAWSVYSPGIEFAALLGGTTLPAFRGRGLYSATVARRAQDAVARGVRLLHVDASPDSAPILRRRGFHEVTTSVHYQWTPPELAG
jgi:hypothetical protein